VERLGHYFSTYKLVPGTESRVAIEKIYGHEEALRVVRAAIEDYAEAFGQYIDNGPETAPSG
jgi:inorganic pyrophosphatase